MSTRERVNDVLVHLFREVNQIEERAIINEEFKEITNNDMHVIEAVGLEGNNMSTIAKKLGITVGSLTTSMNSLVKKHYVNRVRSEVDRRVVNISLTEKGVKAFEHHKRFHEKMVDAIMKNLNDEEAEMLDRVLGGLLDFYRVQNLENQNDR